MDYQTEKPKNEDASRPCDDLALSPADISLVTENIDKIREKLSKSLSFGMVFDAVVGFQREKDGDTLDVVIKKPRYAKPEFIENDILNRERQLKERGEYRFAPTYRLPGTNLFVQRRIDGRNLTRDEGKSFFDELTKKGLSLSELGSNTVYDKENGPVVIDVINVSFNKQG